MGVIPMVVRVRPRRIDGELLLRAFRSADTDGSAALNGLLYAAGALLMSAVLLVSTSPTSLAVLLASVPWLMLAIGLWWWLAPALRAMTAADLLVLDRGARARAAAVDILVDDGGTQEDLRTAAGYLLADLEGDERERATRRLLGLGD